MADLTKEIINVLSPVVGDFLAEARVRASFVMLNIDTPSTQDLPRIAEKIRVSMERSLGPVAASQIANQIRELR